MKITDNVQQWYRSSFPEDVKNGNEIHSGVCFSDVLSCIYSGMDVSDFTSYCDVCWERVYKRLIEIIKKGLEPELAMKANELKSCGIIQF